MPSRMILLVARAPGLAGWSATILSFVVALARPVVGQEFCPNRSIVKDAAAALEELRLITDCDPTALERIKGTLDPLGRLRPTELDPACSPAVKRAQRRMRPALGTIARLQAKCEQVTLNLIYSYTGGASVEDFEGLTLNGRAARGTELRTKPGRLELVVAHTPSSGDQTFDVKLSQDQSPVEAEGTREGARTFVVHTQPGQHTEIAIELHSQEYAPAYLVASVTQSPTSQVAPPPARLISNQAIRLRLNQAPLKHDAGDPARRIEMQINEGPSELSVAYPTSTAERWYYLRVEQDSRPLPAKGGSPGRQTFEVVGTGGKTSTLQLVVDSGPNEHSFRPYAIWGGGALAGLGLAVGIAKLVEAREAENQALGLLDDQCETDDRGNYSCPSGDAGEQLDREVNGLYDDHDSAAAFGTAGFVTAGVGALTLAIGYFLLEGGVDDPGGIAGMGGPLWRGTAARRIGKPSSGLASIRLQPVFSAGAYHTHLVGRW